MFQDGWSKVVLFMSGTMKFQYTSTGVNGSTFALGLAVERMLVH